jgi:hypothetical protein
MFTDPLEIIGQALEAAGEVGVGNLGQAKFAHAAFLQGPTMAGRPIGQSSSAKGRPMARAARIEPHFN